MSGGGWINAQQPANHSGYGGGRSPWGTQYDQPSRFGALPLTSTDQSARMISDDNGNVYAVDDGKMFEKYFGRPSKVTLRSPEDMQWRENLQLPDGFSGSNAYIGNYLINRITKEERFPTTRMFPLKRQDSSLDIIVDTITFGNNLMSRVPEESVPRTLQTNRNRDTGTMQRYATSFTMEHGFMNTDEGRRYYVLHLEQMAYAGTETMCFGAMDTAYNWPLHEDEHAAYRSSPENGFNALANMLKPELNQWACVQKSESGFRSIIAKTEQTFLERRNKIAGDTWVFPRGLRQYVQFLPAEFQFWTSGRVKGQERDVIGDTVSSKVWYESRRFTTGEGNADQDPSIRPQTIGSFWMFGDQFMETGVSGEEYKSFHKNCRIFDENADDFVVFDWSKNWTRMGLFGDQNLGISADDRDDAPLSDIGRAYFSASGSKTWGDYLHKSRRLNYFAKSLLSKSTDVQQSFIKTVVEGKSDLAAYEHSDIFSSSRFENDDIASSIASLSGDGSISLGSSSHPHSASSLFGTVATEKKEIDTLTAEAAAAAEGRFRGSGRVGSYEEKYEDHRSSRGPSDISSSTDNIARCFDAKYKPQAEEVAECLAHIDNAEGTNLLDAYQNNLLVNPPARGVDINHDAWYRLGEKILEVDLDSSLRDVKESGLPLSTFELVPASGKKAADATTPKWVWKVGGRKPQQTVYRVFTNPDYDIRSSTILPYASHALQLTSSRVALFALDDTQLNEIISKNGVLDIELPEGSNLEEDKNRTAYLQISIALSAVHARLRRYMAEYKRGPSELLKAAAADIPKLVSPIHATTGDRTIISDAFAQVRKFPHLYVQSFAASSIKVILDILELFYNDQSSYDQEVLIQKVHEAMLVIVKEIQTNHFNSRVLSIRTEGRLDHSGLSKEDTVDLSLRGHGQKITAQQVKFARAAADEALKATEKEIKASDPKKGNEGLRGSIHDSFFTFRLDYSNIYTILFSKVHGQSDDIKRKVKHAGNRLISLVDAFNRELWTAYTKKEADKWKEVFTKYNITPADVIQHVLSELTEALIDYDAATGKGELKPLEDILENVVDEKAIKAAFEFKSTRAKASVNKYYTMRSGIPAAGSPPVVDNLVAFFASLTSAGLDGKIAENPLAATIFSSNRDREALERHLLLSSGTPKGIRTITDASKANIYVEAVRLACGGDNGKSSNAKVNQIVEAIKGNSAPSLGLDELSVKVERSLTRKELFSILFALEIRTAAFIRWCHRNDVYEPLGALGFRPHQQYLMGTALHMLGGGRAGWTYYGFPDFRLSDNVTQKKHLGVLNFYSKTMVTNKEFLIHTRNIICLGYMGGAGTEIYDNLDGDDDIPDYIAGKMDKSLFMAPAMASYRPQWIMDITGNFHPALAADESCQAMTKYESAHIMRELYGWAHHVTGNGGMEKSYENAGTWPKWNTLVFQSTQFIYDHGTKALSNRIFNRGHWGPNEYTGVSQDRCGEVSSFIKPVEKNLGAIMIYS